MDQTVYVRARQDEIEKVLASLPQVLAGDAPDPTGLATGIQLPIGTQALSLIKDDFVIKSRGGTGAGGDTWAPLSPKTIAYGRRHPGLNERRGRSVNWRRPLLTGAQDARWRSLFARALRGLSRRQGGMAWQSSADLKAHAAAYAWMVIKAEGGKTILGEYGATEVEILRDKGFLFNSLSPGLDGPSGHPNQIFQARAGSVIVGTNRTGAGRHHEGKGVPQRRLWPEPARWPANWWDLLLKRLRDGCSQVAQRMIEGLGG